MKAYQAVLIFLFLLTAGIFSASAALTPGSGCPYPFFCWSNGTANTSIVSMSLNSETGELNLTGTINAAGIGLAIGGNISGTGTANRLAKFTAAQTIAAASVNVSNGNLDTAGNVTASFFYGDGSGLTGVAGSGNITGGGTNGQIAQFTATATAIVGVAENTLDVNGSLYWDNLNSPADITGLNEDNILSTNFTVNKSLYWDDLNSPSDITGLDESNINSGNLNVNSSEYWDDLNVPADITGLNEDNVISTNFTVNKSLYWDDLNSPSDITGLDENNINSGNLNVNSSEYWDDLNTPTDITSVGTLTTLTVSGAVLLDLNWTKLQNYPNACSSGTFITEAGDTITCTAPVAADVDPGTFPVGNYTFQDQVNVSNCIVFGNGARIGSNCPQP